MFNFFSQVSHLNEGSMVEVDKYKKKKDKEKVEWAVHQMLSTMDYAPDSTFLKILSVSLNYQMFIICFQVYIQLIFQLSENYSFL